MPLHASISENRPTSTQIDAVRRVVQILASDAGEHDRLRRVCEACQRRTLPQGFVEYGNHTLCVACATTYEVNQTWGEVSSIGQFLQRQEACDRQRDSSRACGSEAGTR